LKNDRVGQGGPRAVARNPTFFPAATDFCCLSEIYTFLLACRLPAFLWVTCHKRWGWPCPMDRPPDGAAPHGFAKRPRPGACTPTLQPVRPKHSARRF
jgi:hypothetical protein